MSAGVFGSFAHRSFRWVWGAALSGNSARFAVLVVAGWQAFRFGHHSSLWPSLVSFLLLFPTTVLGLLWGGLADRLNRAKQAASGQLLGTFGCAVACGFAATGRLGLGGVLAASAVVGLGNSVQGPAWQSLVPNLVGAHELADAAVLTRIAQQGAELTGPALATVLLTELGAAPVWGACAIMYLAGTLMLWRVRGAGRRVATSGWSPQLMAGFRYLLLRQPLATLLLWVTLHCCLTMASLGILPAVASADLHGSAGGYGALLTSFGVGSVAGPLLLLAWQPRRPARVLAVTGLASGLPLVGLGLTHSAWLAFGCAVLAGAGQASFMAVIYGSVMAVARDGMRGRVSSMQLAVTTGVMGTASIAWGGLVGVLAPGLVLAIPGLAFVLASVPFIRRAGTIDAQISRARAGMGGAPGAAPGAKPGAAPLGVEI